MYKKVSAAQYEENPTGVVFHEHEGDMIPQCPQIDGTLYGPYFRVSIGGYTYHVSHVYVKSGGSI